MVTVASGEFKIEQDGNALHKIEAVAFQELTKVAHVFLGDANDTIPYDTWDMRNTGQVSADEQNQTVYVSYDTPYVVRQHEDLTLKHKSGRRARWLELTAQENQEEYKRLLASQIRKRIEGA